MASAVNPARKRVAMLIVAIGSVLIVQRVVALSSDDGEPVMPTVPAGARAAAASSAAPAADQAQATTPETALRTDRLAQRLQIRTPAASAPAGALFDVVAWQPPAPKVVAPPPAPKPVAPLFPYPYLGGLSEDGVRTSFFTKGNRVLPVKAGDVVDAAYRVDLMTDKQMTLTYLPLNETLVVVLEGTP